MREDKCVGEGFGMRVVLALNREEEERKSVRAGDEVGVGVVDYGS